jgi:hypothetical protein
MSKFQDKLNSDSIKPKNIPQPVELIAIPVKMLPSELVASNHKSNDDRLLVFTGAVVTANNNIYYNHQSILRNAGYSGNNFAEKFSIPGIHEQKYRKNKGSSTYFATAQSISPDELNDTFPNARIVIVKSFDEFVERYKKLVQEQKELIEMQKAKHEEKKVFKKLNLTQKTYGIKK